MQKINFLLMFFQERSEKNGEFRYTSRRICVQLECSRDDDVTHATQWHARTMVGSRLETGIY
jgi:hypothetical protein